MPIRGRRVVGAVDICGKCGTEYHRRSALSFNIDEQTPCGHTVRDVDRCHYITVNLYRDSKRRGRPIEIAIRCGVFAEGITVAVLNRRLGKVVRMSTYLIGPQAREIRLSALRRDLRNEWRDLVLPPGWRQRRGERLERQYCATREFMRCYGFLAVTYDRARAALRAAAYSVEHARLWLELAEYIGRDATWSELKEAAGAVEHSLGAFPRNHGAGRITTGINS